MGELRAALDAADRSLPDFVWRELSRYVECGDPEQGFAWLECRCGHHRFLPFSCKGRGFCPGCGGRRMAERSARWDEAVLPHVPHRQWVLTVPWARRKQLAFRPELAQGVLGVALQEVFGWLEARAEADLGVTGARAGAVTVEQRFASSLALNLHFHSLLPDGVFSRAAQGGLLFHRVRPTRADLERLVERIADRCEVWLEAEGVDDDEVDPDDAQAVLVAASAAGRVAAGPRAGQAVRRWRDLPPAAGDQEQAPSDGVTARGYSLHAGTWVPAQDRAALRRLARYLLRPPLAKARLEQRPDGLLLLTMRKPWRDGTTGFVYSPLELTEKLAALVLRPHVRNVHFHGVFASRSAWRADVVAFGRPSPPPERAAPDKESAPSLLPSPNPRMPSRRPAWCPWAELLEQEFGTNGLRCPRCGGVLHLRTVVVGPPATTKILASLARSSRAPP